MDNPWLWLALLLVVVAIVFLWWQRRQADDDAPLSEDDRFAPVAAISPVEMELLNYLVRAFPGRPVLFRSALSRLVAVRRAQRRLGAQQRLATHVVDYVVCNRDGKPVYAFELDAVHDDAEEAEQDALEKHRVLKTAGIRLIRLKRTTRDMPPPDEFRHHLRAAALPQQDAASAPAPLAPPQPRGVELDSKPPRVYEHANGAQPVFRDTMPMSVTDLMGLPPVADDEPDDDPWGSRRRGA